MGLKFIILGMMVLLVPMAALSQESAPGGTGAAAEPPPAVSATPVEIPSPSELPKAAEAKAPQSPQSSTVEVQTKADVEPKEPVEAKPAVQAEAKPKIQATPGKATATGNKKPKQQARPEGAFSLGTVPVGLDVETKSELFNYGLDRLNKVYRLVPSEVYQRAEVNALAEGAKCPGAECDTKIQETLKVNRLLRLDIAQKETEATLSLSLLRGKKTFQRSESCRGCSVTQFKEKIQVLVAGIVTDDLGAPPPLEELAKKIPEKKKPAPAPLAEKKMESVFSKLPLWVYISAGVVVAALLSSAGGGGGGNTGNDSGNVGITW